MFEITRLSQIHDRTSFSLAALCIMNTFSAKMRSTPGHNVIFIEEEWKAIANETMSSYLAVVSEGAPEAVRRKGEHGRAARDCQGLHRRDCLHVRHACTRTCRLHDQHSVRRDTLPAGQAAHIRPADTVLHLSADKLAFRTVHTCAMHTGNL